MSPLSNSLDFVYANIYWGFLCLFGMVITQHEWPQVSAVLFIIAMVCVVLVPLATDIIETYFTNA